MRATTSDLDVNVIHSRYLAARADGIIPFHGVRYYVTQFGPSGVRGLSDIGSGLDGMEG